MAHKIPHCCFSFSVYSFSVPTPYRYHLMGLSTSGPQTRQSVSDFFLNSQLRLKSLGSSPLLVISRFHLRQTGTLGWRFFTSSPLPLTAPWFPPFSVTCNRQGAHPPLGIPNVWASSPRRGQSPASASRQVALSAFSPRPPHSPSGLARYHTSSPLRFVSQPGPAGPSPSPPLRLHPRSAHDPAPTSETVSRGSPQRGSQILTKFPPPSFSPHPHLRPYNGPEAAESPPAAPEGGHIAVRDPDLLQPEVTLGPPP